MADNLTRPRPIMTIVLHDNPAIDDDIFKPCRISVGVLKGSVIANHFRVKHDHVGRMAGFYKPPALKLKGARWQGSQFPDCLFKL